MLLCCTVEHLCAAIRNTLVLLLPLVLLLFAVADASTTAARAAAMLLTFAVMVMHLPLAQLAATTVAGKGSDAR
jgi:hypothetical protein